MECLCVERSRFGIRLAARLADLYTLLSWVNLSTLYRSCLAT